ncbi:MAG TPA: hypothetical protein VFL99_12435 [Segeticoccus sp.]|uniref:hypothetical protein n=1 Tax=Segeticoccus sp. TaxID=2706531 RepID=UPI002D7F0BE4|nr:hypothetical protein [Segeticoccus sp.]HET8601128.1 hypothetical protein [Segeticoccus sp.]
MAEFAETDEVRRQFPHPRLLLASLLVCAVLLAGLGAWAVYQHRHPGRGPLSPREQGLEFTSTGIPVGATGLGTFAMITLANATTVPAVIDDVRLVPPPDGPQVRLVGSWVVHSSSGALWSAFGGPPQQHYPVRHDAHGAVIPGHSGAYVLGLTLASRAPSSLSRIDGVDVLYHVDGQHYRDRWPDQVVLCPGSSCAPWRTSTGGQPRWPPKPAYLP